KQTAIQGEIDALTPQIPQLEQTLGTHNAMMEKAEDAYRNGSMAASITHTIISNQRTLTAQGFSKQGSTFILAGSKFEPHPMPPASLEAITGDTANSGNLAGTLWTAKTSFYVYEMPSGPKVSKRLDSRGFLQPARAESVVPKSTKKMFLFEFGPGGKIVATALPQQPFLDIPVSERQLFGVSYQAYITGEDGSVPVTWTATLRDLTAKLGRQQGGRHGGEPMVGTPGNWCEQPAFGKQRRPDGRGSEGRGSRGGRGFGLGQLLQGLL